MILCLDLFKRVLRAFCGVAFGNGSWLLPRHVDLALIRDAVVQVEINKRLIWDPRSLRFALEVVNRTPVKVDRYLLFDAIRIGILTRIKILDIVFLSHKFSPCHFK